MPDTKVETQPDNRKLRLAIISSVPPDPNRIAGALILARWLDHPEIEWTYIEPTERNASFTARLLDRLTRTRFHRLARPMKTYFDYNRFAVWLRTRAFFIHCLARTMEWKPDILLSVAHGAYYKIAHRVSKDTGIPLVLLAQDWWPAFPEVKERDRPKEERQFISICADSAATIAVSEGMYEELGRPANTCVIHDIPSTVESVLKRPTAPPGRPLKIVYAGNLSTYGPMVEKAALACMESETVRLEIFGRDPIHWSPGIKSRLQQAGIFRGFVAPSEFPRVAAEYDGSLAIMSFEAEMRQRMKTSFPSKIIELAQLGKPVIVWTPEDSSAAAWARRSGAALCVTEESPDALMAAFEDLAKDISKQRSLTDAIRASALDEFNPAKIRQKFMEVLSSVAAGKPRIESVEY